MKKLLVLLLSAVLAFSATAALAQDFGDVANDPQVTLTYAEVNPLDSIVGQTGTAFKDKVFELTGGSVIIDIQASGVLGSETVVLDSMLAGGDTVDMSRISAFALTTYGCVKSKLLSLPYTFAGRAHYWNFANSELAKEFLMEPQELGLGVFGIFYGEEGFRNFFFRKGIEVTGIDSLKGLKIRVSNDPVMTGMVNGLGASATPVDYNELYSALQTGVVDGAEQPIANYKSKAFYEVADSMILDGHTLGAVQVIVSEASWAKLTENQQAAVLAAAQYAQDFNAALSASAEEAVLQELKDMGVNFVEVPDNGPWSAACADIIAQNIVGQEELYQQILDMK